MKKILFQLLLLISFVLFLNANFHDELEGECIDCHSLPKKHTFKKNVDKCEKCHKVENWTELIYSHKDFKINGKHSNLKCEKCHPNGSVKSKECVNCHINYHKSTLGNDCEKCHTYNNWIPTKFKHSDTGFNLTGSHKKVDCVDCHKNKNYKMSSSECIKCHLKDMPSNHYGTDCGECHKPTQWKSVDFDHIYFPIPHNGNSDCTICHPNPNNKKVFDCLSCHKHRQDRIDSIHKDVVGYQYNSQSCYNCHPDGDN